MPDEFDRMLDERAASAETDDMDAMLDARAATDAGSGKPSRQPTEADRAALKEFGKPEDLPWYKRSARGEVDPILGSGQIVQNVTPDYVMNAGRKMTDPLVNMFAGGEAKDTSNTSTAEFNRAVRTDEAGYQAQRAAAGQSGIDVARIAGTVANPITWLGPVKGGPGVLAGIKAGAQAGAFQALLQPVTSSGSFLYDKAMQGLVGGVAGGTLGGAFAKLAPLFGKAREALGKAFGQADRNAQAAAAAQVADDALRAVNADPALVDPAVRTAIKTEVGDALRAGVNPDPVVMTNRADAAALPVPMQYTRGQATRDNLLYSWEKTKSKLKGYEDLNEILTGQNRQLIENMNELGARNALSPFEASEQAISRLQQIDDGLKKGVTEAYEKVKNSAGQSALMDSADFLDKARAGLRGQEDFLPSQFRSTLNALELGQTPLTVNTVQQLDKQLYTEMANTTNGNIKSAINAFRQALNGAKLSDTLGDDSMRQYKAAKQLHAQRMGLIEDNPAYKAVVDGKAEAEKFFANYVAGSNVSQLPGLKQLLGPEVVKTIKNTTVGQLKKAALGPASDENGVFGQAGYNSVLQSDVMGPRLRAWFADEPVRLGHLYRLGRVAENIVKYPSNHNVNTSNSATVGAELLREGLESGSAGIPIVGGLVRGGRKYTESVGRRQAIKDSVSPTVTREPLRPKQSKTQARLSDLLSRGTAAAGPADLISRAFREDKE